MQLPRFSRRRGADNGTKPSAKNKGLYLAVGAAVFLLGLLLSFYIAFPDQALRQRLIYELENRLPIQVDLNEVTLRPVLTLTGRGMTARSSGQKQPLLQIDNFSVGPQWLKLFSGDPGLAGEVAAATGELSFSWLRSGPLDVSASSFPLDLPLATNPATRFSGTLNAAEITTSVPLQDATESRLAMNFNQVSVKGLEALTANANGLFLGEISFQMSGQGTSFSINRLETSGGDLVVSGSGTLMLVTANPQNSRINLNLSVRAGDQADPTLTSLLELVGSRQSDGSRKVRLTGTLAKPIAR